MQCCPRNSSWCVILACVHQWMASNSEYALPLQSSPQESVKWQVLVTLKAKFKWTIPREFHGYWWLVQMLHVSRYGTRLAEERRRIRKKERRWTILELDRFRFATLKWLLDITITTTDWGKLYKLLYVLLQASISFPAILSQWKC